MNEIVVYIYNVEIFCFVLFEIVASNVIFCKCIIASVISLLDYLSLYYNLH